MTVDDVLSEVKRLDKIREYKIVKPYLDIILNDVKEHEVEFELFGISDNYISVGILKGIIEKLLSKIEGGAE